MALNYNKTKIFTTIANFKKKAILVSRLVKLQYFLKYEWLDSTTIFLGTKIFTEKNRDNINFKL